MSKIVYLDSNLADFDRVELRDSRKRWLATFTRAAYTVTLPGPERTFSEGTATVRHSVWVRTLPKPFDGGIPAKWLNQAREANRKRELDILGIAMQYTQGALPVIADRRQIAGGARYGPLVDGKRQEGSDFNDYLGVPWNYPGEIPPVDKPEPKQFRSLDCSGFVRMVWGYRHHKPNKWASIPLSLKSRRDKSAIPRRAFQICASAPGVMVVQNSGTQVLDFSRMQVGDLVFFDADACDGPQIDHVGIYLGKDTKGHHRFISSRKRANGPTLRDFRGKSILDGKGYYAKAFRAVRRL